MEEAEKTYDDTEDEEEELEEQGVKKKRIR